jgi:UDP-glucose 4-epimerase
MRNKALTILVTGGAGYIGSHVCVELILAGFKVVVVDNLSNSSIEAIARIKTITKKSIDFYKVDINSSTELDKIFNNHKVDAVIHLAGLKSVSESNSLAIDYYQTNVSGAISLCKSMQKYDCSVLVFSSSATVYAPSGDLPIKENYPLLPSSPYGRTKLTVESFLNDIYLSGAIESIGVLRYFNPVGAHTSGLIGEDPKGIPSNLMPYISQVAIGNLDKLYIYGSDYNTHDGTGVRDYIHVVDLARGHVSALKYFLFNKKMKIINLGTGKGNSVLELISSFEKSTDQKIPYMYTGRRDGDIDAFYADNLLAKKLLKWSPVKSLDQMCRDSWNWQSKNPNGYL